VTRKPVSIPAALVLVAGLMFGSEVTAGQCPAFLNQDFKKLRSEQSINLCEAYPGKPLLIVNTASHCGYTPQFKGLEALNQKYRARGLVVVGFPSDDFKQEAKQEAETAEICYINYRVTFTMLSPSVVTGRNTNPVFKELARIDSNVKPDSAQLNQAIEQLLE
jgi:glutathione peroxidase